MPRQFGTPVGLPADPVNPLDASTKQYVDTGDTSLSRTKQPAPARWTNWRSRPAGTQIVTGSLSDDGTAFLVSNTGAETASIANNRLEVSWPNSTGGALYVQQSVSATVRRIGASFAFGPCANTTTAAIALATWDTPSPTPGTTNAQIHCAITAASTTFGVVVNGSVINLVNWPHYVPLAQNWTTYHAEVAITGSTAYVSLPDGQSQTITDSRIASIQGMTACWEYFRDGNTTTAPIAFLDVWAASMAPLNGVSSRANTALAINTYRSEVNTLLAAKAPTASPTFTGTVTVPAPVNATDPTTKSYVDSADALLVPQTQRGPIGGVAAFPSLSGSFNLNFSNTVARWTLTGNVNVSAPSGATAGQDGQVLRIEALASGADRVVAFSGFEVALGVGKSAFSIPNGLWMTFYIVNRNGTYRLLDVDYQFTPQLATVAYSATPQFNAAASSYWVVTMTGNITGIGVTGLSDGQILTIELFASGAARTFTTTGIQNKSGKTLAYTIASGTSSYATFINSSRGGVTLTSLT